jgi:hypothetical protein
MAYICIVSNRYNDFLHIVVSHHILFNAHMILQVYTSHAETIKRLLIAYLITYDYNKSITNSNIDFEHTILDIIIPYLTSNNMHFTIINTDDYSNTCCFFR